MAKTLRRMGALLLAAAMCLGMLGVHAFAEEGDSTWWWDTTGETRTAYEAYQAAESETSDAYNAWDAAYDAMKTAENAADTAESAYNEAKAELDGMTEGDEGYDDKAAQVNDLKTAWDEAEETYQAACSASENAYDAYVDVVNEANRLYGVYADLAKANYPFTGVMDEASKTLSIAVSGDIPAGAQVVFEGYFVMLDDEGARDIYTSLFSSTVKDNVTTLVLGEGISGIDNYACNNWDTLETVVLPESLTYIGNAVFSSCTGLASIDLSHVKTFGENAFWGAFDADADVNIVLNGP